MNKIITLHPTGQERRRSIRIEFNASYRFTVGDEEFVGNLCNITEHGAFLAGNIADIAGSAISSIGELHITADSKELFCKAQIVYVNNKVDDVFPSGVGVMFVDFGDSQKMLLAELIDCYQNADKD
jgi:PilZ domain